MTSRIFSIDPHLEVIIKRFLNENRIDFIKFLVQNDACELLNSTIKIGTRNGDESRDVVWFCAAILENVLL